MRNSLHNYIGKKEWEGESKNTAVNILVRNNAIHGISLSTCCIDIDNTHKLCTVQVYALMNMCMQIYLQLTLEGF